MESAACFEVLKTTNRLRISSAKKVCIVDFIFPRADVKKGLLTDVILDQFRATEITSLKLTASLNDENGLNLAASDILPGS